MADEGRGDAALDVGVAFLAGYGECSRGGEDHAPDLEADFDGELGEEVKLGEGGHCRVNGETIFVDASTTRVCDGLKYWIVIDY